ncbi:MAG TPA: c-type cytochrome [Kofleriaceae bacterium]|jgi:mono/diheme cytochrome c family protein
MRAFMNVVIALAIVGCGKKSTETSAGSGSAKPAETKPADTGSANEATGGSGGNVAGGGGGTAAPVDAAVLKRGEYLANVLGCNSCHFAMTDKGPDFSRPYAGGLAVPEKYGTWHGPNITQDKATGIGSWTDEQIGDAIRTGITPSGGQLYPIMPYLKYNRLTDDDTKALVAFLRTVKPIENVVPKNDLKMPKPPATKPTNAPDPADALGHGEYLVTIMHCAMCHSAKDKPFAGGAEFDLPFLGTGTLYGANLTSDPETGIGKWSIDDIKKSISTLTRPDGTIIQGPMQLYLAGWTKLEDKDLTAIATYIKSIPPQANKVPASTFKPNAPPAK